MKIDYKQEVASNYTTFPQTPQSQAILSKNNNSLGAGAKKATNDIAQKATAALRSNNLGRSLNVMA